MKNVSQRRFYSAEQSLDALRTPFPLLLALGHDGGAEAGAEVVRKFVGKRIAVDLDGLLGCVANHIAVVAPGEMILQFGFCVLIEDAVQIIGQLLQEVRAFHWLPSPLSRFWK